MLKPLEITGIYGDLRVDDKHKKWYMHDSSYIQEPKIYDFKDVKEACIENGETIIEVHPKTTKKKSFTHVGRNAAIAALTGVVLVSRKTTAKTEINASCTQKYNVRVIFSQHSIPWVIPCSDRQTAEILLSGFLHMRRTAERDEVERLLYGKIDDDSENYDYCLPEEYYRAKARYKKAQKIALGILIIALIVSFLIIFPYL